MNRRTGAGSLGSRLQSWVFIWETVRLMSSEFNRNEVIAKISYKLKHDKNRADVQDYPVIEL